MKSTFLYVISHGTSCVFCKFSYFATVTVDSGFWCNRAPHLQTRAPNQEKEPPNFVNQSPPPLKSESQSRTQSPGDGNGAPLLWVL